MTKREKLKIYELPALLCIDEYERLKSLGHNVELKYIGNRIRIVFKDDRI